MMEDFNPDAVNPTDDELEEEGMHIDGEGEDDDGFGPEEEEE